MKKKALPVLLAAVLIFGVAAVILLVRSDQRRADRYQLAVLQMNDGNRDEAYRLFKELGNYRDCEDLAARLADADPLLVYRAAGKDDTVFFGRWEQDNDPDNGPEPIEWIVLEKIEGRLLLISSSCLAGMVYNTEPFTPVTWETCTLRAWLNDTFLTSAFTGAEQAWIPTVTNENPDHSVVGTPGGRDTRDRVFLLCEGDTVIYLSNDPDREAIGKAPATAYAAANGLQTNEEGFASWWLRSPGMYEYIAQFVDQDGLPYTNGASVDIDYLCGVRPVLWLDTAASGEGAQP